MSKQGSNEDFSFTIIMTIMIVLMAIGAFFIYKADMVLIPWKYIRAAELAATFQLETLSKMWNYSFTSYNAAFDFVNERVWNAYRWLGVPIIVIGLIKMTKVNFNWTMEDTLAVGYQRFKWLQLVFVPASGIRLIKKFPFISIDLAHSFPKVELPNGVDPIDYFKQHRDNLPEVLKAQLGPQIKIEDKKIMWQDQFAKEVAYECYKKIPDKKPTPDSKSWREMAWQNCVQNHRYERTFALGMLQAARDFGVYNVTSEL